MKVYKIQRLLYLCGNNEAREILTDPNDPKHAVYKRRAERNWSQLETLDVHMEIDGQRYLKPDYQQAHEYGVYGRPMPVECYERPYTLTAPRDDSDYWLTLITADGAVYECVNDLDSLCSVYRTDDDDTFIVAINRGLDVVAARRKIVDAIEAYVIQELG